MIKNKFIKIKPSVGCGTNYKDGCINTDYNSDSNAGRLLREAGCEKIQFLEIRKVKHTELRNLEVRKECELIVEATK